MLNFLAAVSGNGAGGGGSFESIATVTASGGEMSLSFSSIPQTYQHLQIRGMVRDAYTGASTETNSYIRYNGISTSSYAVHYLSGDGSAVNPSGASGFTYQFTIGGSVYDGATANIFGVLIIDLLDYSSTTKNTTMRSFGGADLNGSGKVSLNSGLFVNTNAITSIEFPSLASGSGYKAGTTFALYGIKGA